MSCKRAHKMPKSCLFYTDINLSTLFSLVVLCLKMKVTNTHSQDTIVLFTVTLSFGHVRSYFFSFTILSCAATKRQTKLINRIESKRKRAREKKKFYSVLFFFWLFVCLLFTNFSRYIFSYVYVWGDGERLPHIYKADGDDFDGKKNLKSFSALKKSEHENRRSFTTGIRDIFTVWYVTGRCMRCAMVLECESLFFILLLRRESQYNTTEKLPFSKKVFPNNRKYRKTTCLHEVDKCRHHKKRN